jgi:hypothetical protein
MENILGIGSRIKHPAYGEGVVIEVNVAAYKICFMQYGLKNLGKEYEGFEIIEKIDYTPEQSFTAAEKSLNKILRFWGASNEVIELGNKWDNGLMILKPDDETLKPKEIPIETFFHKIVMTRDRLRVMEQRINSSKLTDEEKVNLQQYISRIYGSLTTFNVLFKNKEDHFKGSSK